MKYFSTFSGIGGFELGIERAYENMVASKNNSDIIKGCNVRNVKKELSSTIITNQNVKNAYGSIKLSGEKITTKGVLKQEESITDYEEIGSCRCMEQNVPVVGSLKKNSLHSNIKTVMDIKIESGMEQDICTNSPSKKKTLINTKSSVTTVTTPKGGMENAPICVGFSEIDKYAIQIYEKHFPTHTNFGDITKINEKTLPDFDLLVGGFPCQSFSIAGKRGGFEDTRGTMFFEIARIVREKQPRLLLLENVKGLLSHDKGATFHTIISTLDELGYDCQWQVLNSKNHGVPQNRERVFIIGHLRGTSRPEVFPFGESSSEPVGEANKQGCANTLTGRSAGGQNRRGNYIKIDKKGNIKKDQVNAATLTGGAHSGGNHSDMDLIQLNHPKHSNDRVYSKEGISPTLNTAQGGNRQPFIVAQRGRYINDPKSRVAGLPTKQILEPNLKGVSNTLSTVQKDNMLCDHESKIRRLTPTECERLQGFPDGWTKKGRANDWVESVRISDTQRYKTLGNAVTTNVIRDIVDKLI